MTYRVRFGNTCGNLSTDSSTLWNAFVSGGGHMYLHDLTNTIIILVWYFM